MDISLTGKTHSDAIKTWLPLSILTPIDGVLSYQFGLHLPLKRKGGEAGSPYLLVRSDLTGASVELPAPFGKDPASKKPFSIKVDLNQTPTPIHIAYGKQLKVALKTQDHQLQRAHIQLGGDDARMPASDAIEIRGMLERFDSTQWMAVLDTLNASAQQSTDPNSPSILTQIDNSSVYVDNLIIEDKNWGGTTVAVNQLGDVWNLNVKNDSVTGNAKVPFGVLASDWGRSNPKQNIDVRLKHLTIIKSEQTQENTEWEPLALSPKTLPSASVVIDKFQLGKANFGRWNIIAKPTQQGMDLKADVRMSGLSAKGIGQWFQPDGKEPATHVNVDLKGKNAADIMQTMGFEPALTSEAAIGNADLRWPGSPIDFSLQRAQGELSVDVENGRFLNVNSNAAGKLWGALNFETLLRRVQLDFTDLSESEMVYDEINGAMTLMPGVLTLDNVDLNSPALKLKLDGDIDLKQDTLNLGMDVTVPITRNLVLPAAVIGGVPAAATAFVVEKVLGSQLDKLTTIKYRIEGSFDEPKVRAKDSFSLFPKQVSDSAISNSPLKTTDPAGATP